MRTRRARQASAGLALAVLVALTGCSAGTPLPAASSPAPSAEPSVVAPADGVSLAALGLTHGPVSRVFLPATVQASTRVDQANNVTLVIQRPAADELAGYLRRTLPASGFTVTADNPATTTLTFAGFGWTGTFTGDAAASALLLRPVG